MALIKVKINTGSLVEKIVWNHESDIMMLSITHQAIDGYENKHIAAYLSAVLDMPKENVSIIDIDNDCKIIEIENDLSFIKDKILQFNNR